MLLKYIKFCIVGGTGALITFGVTWLLTEKFGWWYMGSLIVATLIAMTSNFLFNNYWTFSVKTRTPSDADYEWFAFHNGNPIQRWWKRSIAKTVWEWIPNSSLLLDIGCGSSPIITKYEHAVGLDSNKSKIEFMQEKINKTKDVNFFHDKTTNNFMSKTFDYVLCIEVIEHCTKPMELIKEISRVVVDKGKVVIATPDYNRKLWHIAEMFTPYKDEHITRLNKKLLESFCKEYGLYPVAHKYIAGCDLVELFEKR